MWTKPVRNARHPQGDDDAGEPDSGAEFVEEKIAGDLEDKVAEEENAGEQAELLAGDSQVAVHGKGGEADVDAVKERDDVEDKDEGNDSEAEFTDESGFVERGWGHVRRGGFVHLEQRMIPRGVLCGLSEERSQFAIEKRRVGGGLVFCCAGLNFIHLPSNRSKRH